MAISEMSKIIQHLRLATDLRDEADWTDSQLLTCFIAQRDEAAFATLLRRHGPMVWGVCRRVVGSQHDAEDAFQATFLILVRKAASLISRELLANWLYGVAHRTALHAKTTNVRRQRKERQVAVIPEREVVSPDHERDWQPLLDQELSRLPDKYRAVVVLCDLEGKTRREVAAQLRLPEGTVAGRLARARALLAKRLTRSGLAVPGAFVATALAKESAAAAVPAKLMADLHRMATACAWGQATGQGAIPAPVVALVEKVLESMLMTKLKILAAVFFLLALASSGAGLLAYTLGAPRPSASATTKTPQASPGAPGGKDAAGAAKLPAAQAGPTRMQVEHKSPVLSLAWSPTGQWIATGAKDGTLRITDTATGKEIRTMATGNAVVAISFAPDSRTLAIGQLDGSASIWDTATGQKLADRNVFINKPAPELLAFTSDSQAIVAVKVGGFSEWKPNMGAGGIGMGPADGIPAMAIDGSICGWVQADGFVVMRSYDPMAMGLSSAQIQRLEVGKAHSLAFAPAGKLLAIGADDKGVELWDLKAKKKTMVLTGLAKPAAKLVFSADGRTLAALAGDNTSIRVWDLGKKTTVGQITHNRGAVGALALSPDGKMLATTGVDDKLVDLAKAAAREITHKGPPLELSAKELAALWTDLGSPDNEKADGAWRKLGGAGDNAIPYLGQVIRPIAVPAGDIKQIEKLVAELDSDKFTTREKAAKELLAAGPLAIVPLQRLLEKPPSIEAAKRAETLLKKLDEPALTLDQRRVLDAIELLEQLRTAKAMALLQEIERDALVSPIRMGARQALLRLAPAAEGKK
jgi:RNA polymerase sigma factor (sigma-70 family)